MLLHKHLECLQLCKASFLPAQVPFPEAPKDGRRRVEYSQDIACNSVDEVWPAAYLSTNTSAATASFDGRSQGVLNFNQFRKKKHIMDKEPLVCLTQDP